MDNRPLPTLPYSAVRCCPYCGFFVLPGHTAHGWDAPTQLYIPQPSQVLIPLLTLTPSGTTLPHGSRVLGSPAVCAITVLRTHTTYAAPTVTLCHLLYTGWTDTTGCGPPPDRATLNAAQLRATFFSFFNWIPGRLPACNVPVFWTSIACRLNHTMAPSPGWIPYPHSLG